ncbi:MAG: PorT family protein [Alloprevotella sp.]|nr:PorT family protein [Alloprevotella sp.]
MNTKRISTILLFSAAFCWAGAQTERHSLAERQANPVEQEQTAFERNVLHGWDWSVGAGMELGGMAPLPLPREIRKIESYNPLLNFYVEGVAEKRIEGAWHLRTGLRLEQKGMKTKARVKNYHMEMTADDGGYMEGAWTGMVETKAHNIYLTLPVTASYHFEDDRWEAHAGPYFSFLLNGGFNGAAYDGYIRHHDPTGEKAYVTHATYDFGDEERFFVWGLQLGGSYHWNRHWGVVADLAWNANGIFPGDFESITFALYPVYAKFGISYRLNR